MSEGHGSHTEHSHAEAGGKEGGGFDMGLAKTMKEVLNPEELLTGHGGIIETVENVGMSTKAGFDILGSMAQVATGGQGPEGAGGGGGGDHGHH